VLTLSSAVDEPLREVIVLVSRELTNVEPGQQTVLDRLLDVLLVLALRSDFRRSATAPRWYRASGDPRLHAALQAMHEDAGHSWTVPELAAISGLSRAAFARVFRDALGQAPLQYLTEWRMTLARDHLRAGELSLANIAAAVGYGSPYAFTAAFRRHHGIAPGAWRQQQSTAPLTLNGAEDPAARTGRSRLNGGPSDVRPAPGKPTTSPPACSGTDSGARQAPFRPATPTQPRRPRS
jgi:AraC-like DNA-binding protein